MRNAVEKANPSVRAFFEHPFHIVRKLLRHRKVRYRGVVAKKGRQLYTLFGLANVVIGARRATAWYYHEANALKVSKRANPTINTAPPREGRPRN